MRLFGGLFSARQSGPADVAYQKAMTVSDDLLNRMRDSTLAGDVNRTLLSSLVKHRHNVPFLASVYETVQEMSVPNSDGGDSTH